MKWDVSTVFGQWQLEQFLMGKMGFALCWDSEGLEWWQRGSDPASDPQTKVAPLTWLLGESGMTELKYWAAREHGLVVHSYTLPDGSGCARVYRTREGGSEFILEEYSVNEPIAVAVAVGRTIRKNG